MKKIFTIIICSLVLLPAGHIFAQQTKHELSVTGGLGSSSLKFDVNNGDRSQKFGGSFGIGYSYLINENFSINSGLEMNFYNTDATLNTLNDSYKAKDTEGEFVFNTRVSDYKESLCATYLNIPIMGQYQYPVIQEHQFYVALGGKIGIPVSSSYKTSGAAFKTSGTFTDQNGEMENIPGLGFAEFKGKNVKEDTDFKVSFMLSFETGMKWKLSPSVGLYTGIYFDYGLNDIRKGDKDQQFLVYQSPERGVKAEDFHLNSILYSQYTENGTTQSMTGKVVPMAIGLKLRLAFGLPQ